MLRTDYNDQDAVGKCGDVGSYSEYVAGNYANGYTYTRSGNTIAMTGEGAVGYKVYDKDGNLLYFANTNSFVLPQTVADKLAETGQKMVLKVAQADGTDVVLPKAGATVYELKVYHANALSSDKSNTIYTDGTAQTLPVLTNNAIAIIQPNASRSTLPTTLTQATNVVNGEDKTAYMVVLTDKQDFYTPTNFTAQTLTYQRANTAGYNSVCLPFAIHAADFGAGAKLEAYTQMNESKVNFTTITDNNEAGRPCLVYCPADVTEWNIEKTDAYVVANPSTYGDGNATLYGAFTNNNIGAGCYKLSADGNALGITSEKGKVTAFRCYLKPTGMSQAPQRLFVIHDDAATTGITTLPIDVTTSAPIYDLSGRRMQQPHKPGLYIVNGQKVMVK